MSRRLPACTGQDVLRALERAGFYVHHVKGSHHGLRHPKKPGLRVVVPVHRKEVFEAIKRENRAAAEVRPEDMSGLGKNPPPKSETAG